MTKLKISFTVIVFITIGIGNVFGNCYNGFTCTSDKKFQICSDDQPGGSEIDCPNDTTCITGCNLPCVTDIKECTFDCNKNKLFTCLGENKYLNCKLSVPQTCSDNLICNESCIESCVTNDTACSKADDFECKSSGFFQHYTDCTKYFMCIENALRPILRNCPAGTVFDVNQGGCRENSECTFPSPPTTPSPPTSPPGDCETGYYCFNDNLYICNSPDDIPKEEESLNCSSILENGVCDQNCAFGCKVSTYEDRCPVPFTCTSSGTFPVINDCTRYYICIDLNGQFEKLSLNCPSGSKFDSVSQKCTSNANATCAVQNSTEDKPTTPTPTTPSTQKPIIKCSTVGFEPKSGVDCKSYILCLKQNDGSILGTEIQCPGTSKFNPTIKQCTNVEFTCKN